MTELNSQNLSTGSTPEELIANQQAQTMQGVSVAMSSLSSWRLAYWKEIVSQLPFLDRMRMSPDELQRHVNGLQEAYAASVKQKLKGQAANDDAVEDLNQVA